MRPRLTLVVGAARAVAEVVKAQLEIEQCSPGMYYPFSELTWKLYEEKTGKKRPWQAVSILCNEHGRISGFKES